MAEKLLKAYSIYVRNAEIISGKKLVFNEYLGIKVPLSEGIRKNPGNTYQEQSVRNFFLETESWNLRHFLGVCEAKTDGDYRDSVDRLRLFGDRIARQSYESILSYHVADGFLSSFLLNHIPSYSTALQFELAHAVACRSSDVLTFRVGKTDRSNVGLDIKTYSIRLGRAEVGSFNISYSYASAGGLLLQIIDPLQAVVYVKSDEKKSELKSMGLILELDGSHVRNVGGGKSRLFDFVESTCRNLFAIDFAAFADELAAGIVLPSQGKEAVIKADFDSLRPSDFEIRIISYPRQSDGGLQFSAEITANLNEQGYALKMVLPKLGIFRQMKPDVPSAFSGVAMIMDANDKFMTDLQLRYPLKHPLYPGMSN